MVGVVMMMMRISVGDGVHSGAGVEARHLVDHPGGAVSPDGGLPPIRRHGKHVGGPIQGADGHPATVGGESYVLHLQVSHKNDTVHPHLSKLLGTLLSSKWFR